MPQRSGRGRKNSNRDWPAPQYGPPPSDSEDDLVALSAVRAELDRCRVGNGQPARVDPARVVPDLEFSEILKVKSGADAADSSQSFELIKTLDDTPLLMVETRTQLEDLIKELEVEQVLGIDVECSAAGYAFTVCLIQISTKGADYVVDAFKLKQDVKILSVIFSNPRIMKVFHACTNDLQWLQEHFQISVVNLFDTQVAMRYLGCRGLGLKVALKDMFNVDKDTQYQKSDFRVRPLPQAYLDYARTDSHFLIGLYLLYSTELKKNQQLLEKFWNECAKLSRNVKCSRREDPYSGVKDDLMKFQRKQSDVKKKLLLRRCQIARDCDDKPLEEILSDRALLNIILLLPQEPVQFEALAKSRKYVEYCHMERVLSTLQYGTNKAGTTNQPDLEPLTQNYCLRGEDPIDSALESYHEKQMKVLDALNEWRHATGKRLDKAAGIILSPDAMKSLVLALPQHGHKIAVLARSRFVQKDFATIANIMALARCDDSRRPQNVPRQRPEATKRNTRHRRRPCDDRSRRK